MKCHICNCEIDLDADLYKELCFQADALGMESLTENEQAYVEGKICSDCAASNA